MFFYVSPRTACRVLEHIRKVSGKLKYQFVTIREFCAYTGVEEELVKEMLVPPTPWGRAITVYQISADHRDDGKQEGKSS